MDKELIQEVVKKTKNLKVLYVEDEKDVRLDILNILYEFFDNITVAIDGEDGYEKFNQVSQFDLIISDIYMPKLSGLDMAKKIRKIDNDVIILFLSANSEFKNFIDTIDVGAEAYLYKPLDINKFVCYLQRIVKKIDARKEQACFLIEQNKKLKELNFKYKTVLETINKNVIFSRTDLRGNIVYVSEAFCSVSGFTKEELIGKSHNVVKSPDMDDLVYAYMWNTIMQEIPWDGDIKNKRKDGTEYWVNIHIEPYYNSNGKHIGYSAVSKDIAAQKEIERLNFSLEMQVAERTKSLQEAKEATEKLHKNTRESIEYASLIQSSLVPINNIFRDYFSEYFVIWHPKDVVGGDIYFFDSISEDECLIMIIDCTGHGVPGAFVTMLVKSVQVSILNEIKNNSDKEVDTAYILSQFNKFIKKLLQQEDESSISNAGFDGGILYYNKSKKIVKYSGANTPLFYVQDGEIKTLSPNRHSIGYKRSDINYQFTEHSLEVEEGMNVYLTTDGYLDQNGGEKSFPFGKRRFRQLIEAYMDDTMADQQEMFLYEMAEWEGDEERNDDVTVVGLKI